MGFLGLIISAIFVCVIMKTAAVELDKRTPKDLKDSPDSFISRFRIPSFILRGNESVIHPQWNESMIEPKDVEGSTMPPANETLIQPRPVEDPHSKQSVNSDCGSHIIAIGTTALIQSKNYPNNYPKKYNCQWIFSAPGALYMDIYCSSFDVYGFTTNCIGSYLRLKSGSLNKKLCGQRSTVYEMSYDDQFQIDFQTNTIRRRGFSCQVRAYGETTTPSTDCPSCGTVNRVSRIVGGVATDANEYPWQVAIVRNSSNLVFCGGSLYNDEYIITAAHCGQAIIDYGISAEVLLGAHNINFPSSAQQRISVEKVIIHPSYDPSSYDYDIALLQLSRKASLNYRVKPACLPEPSHDYDNVSAIATGWGSTQEGGSLSSILLEVEVPTMPNSKCQQSYGSDITSNMICAGVPEGGKDSCQGDSGGSLATEVNGQWVLIGVTSWGYGCARPNYPGVYARVTEFLDWLESNSAGGGNNLCPSEQTSTTTATTPSPNCRCGKVNRQTRIVGGVPTEVNEYPWQAALTSSNGRRPFCGGSIISNQWILTAAHCVHDDDPSNIRVVIGEHDWSTESETPVTERRQIDTIKVHPKYDSYTQNNDIALLRLESLIVFSSDNKIAPVCLPPAQNLYENVNAIVTGWGLLSSGGSQPYKLYEVTVPTMPNSQCQRSYGESAITVKMICAGEAEGGKDSCQGDSGGPMVTTGSTGNFMEIIGIVSWGYGCAEPDYPGVYARVNKFLDWISLTTAGSNSCPKP